MPAGSQLDRVPQADILRKGCSKVVSVHTPCIYAILYGQYGRIKSGLI